MLPRDEEATLGATKGHERSKIALSDKTFSTTASSLKCNALPDNIISAGSINQLKESNKKHSYDDIWC